MHSVNCFTSTNTNKYTLQSNTQPTVPCCTAFWLSRFSNVLLLLSLSQAVLMSDLQRKKQDAMFDDEVQLCCLACSVYFLVVYRFFLLHLPNLAVLLFSRPLCGLPACLPACLPVCLSLLGVC